MLQPVLVGRAVNLHGALVILAVTTGGALAGIAGAFLAVPFLAVAVTVARYGREEFLAHTRPEGSDRRHSRARSRVRFRPDWPVRHLWS